MSVCQGNLGSYCFFAMFHLTNYKRPHLKIWNDVKMIARFPRPCPGKLAGGTQFKIFLRWHLLTHFRIVREPWGILEWGFLQVVTGDVAKVAHGPRFTEILCSSKEMQLPNLLEEFIFVIFMKWLVLRFFSIAWELVNIFWCESCVWPKVHRDTLFFKRSATSQLAGRIHFRDIHEMTCTQIF